MTSRLRPPSASAVSRLTASAFVGGAPGLQLVVSPKGTKTWRLFYRLPGDERRRAMNLGKFPDVSLAEARKRAGNVLRRASDGEDPKRSRVERAKRSSLTAAQAVEAYLAACEAQNDARTVAAKESALRCHFL